MSVPQGSEGSFTFKAKNKHEESLYKIEDERYEIDQAISHNSDVIEVLENAAKKIEDSHGNYELDKSQFTKPRISWIYQVSSKNAKIIEYLEDYPVQTIPVVLNTIRTFQDEFLKKKQDMIPNWRQECIKHWQKSLDHKSFYFRANERKNLVSKEFYSRMKQLMEQTKITSGADNQLEHLNFYTGLEGQEAKELDLKIPNSVQSDHPVRLSNPRYLEHYSKLPQFRFILDDQDVVKTVIKLLYFAIDNSQGQTQRQHDMLVSFSKHFLCLGLVKDLKDMFKLKNSSKNDPENDSNNQDGLPQANKSVPDELLWLDFEDESYKNDLDINFEWLFGSDQHEAVVQIGTTRIDSLKSIPPLKPNVELLIESEQENGSQLNSQSSEQKSDKPATEHREQIQYLNVKNNEKFEEKFETARFLPSVMENQVLLYATKQYYSVIRFFMTLYERVKFAKNIVGKKLKEDLDYLDNNGKPYSS